MLALTRRREVSWAEFMKRNRPHTRFRRNKERNPTSEKPTRSRASKNNKRIAPRAVYVRNMTKGPEWAIRNAPGQRLPSWALLGLRFIGVLVLENIGAPIRIHD